MSNKYFNFSFSFWYPLGIILTFFITLTSAARIDLWDPEKLLLCYVLVYLCAEYVCVSLNFRLCVCLCMLNVYECVCVCVWVSVCVCLFACACLKWAIECVWVYVCVCACAKSRHYFVVTWRRFYYCDDVTASFMYVIQYLPSSQFFSSFIQTYISHGENKKVKVTR